MHTDDEREFAEFILADLGTIFVDGPKWDKPEPPVTSKIDDAGSYLMIWNPKQTPPMKANHYDNEHGEWWYCKSEQFTIQFLRSGFQHNEPFLFEGRIAVATTEQGTKETAMGWVQSVEERYKNLRKWIRKRCQNDVLIYQNTDLPRSPTNPCKVAADIWIGPHALKWLESNPGGRWVQQSRGGKPRAYLIDLVASDSMQ